MRVKCNREEYLTAYTRFFYYHADTSEHRRASAPKALCLHIHTILVLLDTGIYTKPRISLVHRYLLDSRTSVSRGAPLTSHEGCNKKHLSSFGEKLPKHFMNKMLEDFV